MSLKLVNDDAKTFCKLFSQRYQRMDRHQSELLFHSMFDTETRTLVTTRQRNFFRRLCKDMVKLHRFDVILWFTYSAFCRPDRYDLPLMHELLADIPVRDDYSLAQLCQDFALNMYNCNKYNTPISEDTDLYHHYPKGVSMDKEIHPTARRMVALTLLQKVYGLTVPTLYDTESNGLHVTCQAVDQVAQYVWQEAQNRHAAECSWVEEENRQNSQEGIEDREPYPEFQELDRQQAIPGAMLPLLMVAELDLDLDVCYHILETYVLPALSNNCWDRASEEVRQAINQTLYYYTDYLQAIWWREVPELLSPQMRERTDLPNAFVYEALGKGSKDSYCHITTELEQYCILRRSLFELWGSMLEKWGDHLLSVIDKGRYTDHIFTTALVLFFGGEKEKASRFLLRHINKIEEGACLTPRFLILLVRCILNTANLDEANALFGMFSYQMSRAERDKQPIISCSRKMVTFLREAEAHIRQAKRSTHQDHLLHHDILFGNGGIMNFLDRVSAQLDSGLLPERQFRTLMLLTEAFSYPTGVRLHLLGLPDYDHYDKLEVYLPEQMRKLGESCVRENASGKQLYNAIARCDQLRNISIYLQNHLFQLQCAQVKENLRLVTALKQNLPETISEAEQETLIEQIGQISEDLMGLMMISRQGRSEVEQELNTLRECFEQTYLKDPADLLDKLPIAVREDVQNYLVTSSLVFRMMEHQKDDALDYSAALISMTKALELVMHHVYTRLNVCYDESFAALDTDSKKERERKEQITETYFTKKLEPRQKLTLRPYVEFLSSDRFTLWGVDQVLDLDMLSLFSAIPLHTKKESNGHFVLSSFGNDANQNRKLLKKALVCICENYRNRSAHPNVVTLLEVEECRRLLIDGQNLLWILLAILK